jgi:hypothetical protein
LGGGDFDFVYKCKNGWRDLFDVMKFPVNSLTLKIKSDIYAASIVLGPDTFR